MKSQREIENKLIEIKAKRQEIDAAYTMLTKEQVEDWQGTRLEQKWERADAEIILLKWILYEDAT